MRNYDRSKLSPEDAKELDAAIAEVDAVLENTVVDAKAFENAENRFYAIRDKITSVKTADEVKKENIKTFFENLFAKFLKFLNDFVNKVWGYRGFGFYKLV